MESAERLRGLAAPHEPRPFPRCQRSHHAQQRNRTWSKASRKPFGDTSQVSDAIQSAKVRERAVEHVACRSRWQILDRQQLDLDEIRYAGSCELAARNLQHLGRV